MIKLIGAILARHLMIRFPLLVSRLAILNSISAFVVQPYQTAAVLMLAGRLPKDPILWSGGRYSAVACARTICLYYRRLAGDAEIPYLRRMAAILRTPTTVKVSALSYLRLTIPLPIVSMTTRPWFL